MPAIITVAAAKGGVGKCLHGSTEIVDPRTGVVRTLAEVVEDDTATEVLTLRGRTAIGPATIAAKIDSGEQQCLRVTLATGRSVVATLHHPFLTPGGWHRADALEIGASIAIPARLPGPSEPVHMPDAEVDLLALLCAEGGCTDGKVRFTSADAGIVALATRAASTAGMTLTKVKGATYDYRLNGTAPVAASPGECQCGCGALTTVPRWNDRHGGYVAGMPKRFVKKHHSPSVAGRMVARHGLAGAYAKNKAIPTAVFQLAPTQLGRFLAVFWMCDGYVGGRGPEVTLASETMVRQLQHLLLRVGVQSSVSPHKATWGAKTFRAWRLRVYSAFHGAFLQSIGLWGEKRSRLESLVNDRAPNPNVGSPRAPAHLREELRALALGAPGGLARVGRSLEWTAPAFGVASLFNAPTGSIARRPFVAFCEEYGCSDEYAWLFGQEIFWDTVILIEPVGERQVYDLSVEPTRCFVANDIIVHNTTLAYELAATLDGVLVDLDWDSGGATRMWGHNPSAFKRAPLLDALEAGPDGRPPIPRSRPRQPALVPAHSDLAASHVPEALVAECLTSWAETWEQHFGRRFVVVDTHPGANALTDGATQVADLVVVPVVLAAREMDALEGMLRDFAEYRLLLAPNMVPASPPRRYIERLSTLANGVPVAPPISEHRWVRRRLRRAAITLQC